MAPRGSFGASHWTLTARFNDAAGLAERSPVTYRGILVGSVRSIEVTPEAVVAELEINQADLRLPLPVTATVGSASLLGETPRWPWSAVDPTSEGCTPPPCGWLSANAQLCNGGTVVGQEAAPASPP